MREEVTQLEYRYQLCPYSVNVYNMAEARITLAPPTVQYLIACLPKRTHNFDQIHDLLNQHTFASLSKKAGLNPLSCNNYPAKVAGSGYSFVVVVLDLDWHG